MLNLLVKDFKLLLNQEKTKKETIFSWLFNAFILLIFLLIETFIFYSVLVKIKAYDQAPLSFFVIFLSIISILMIFSALIQAKKLFFNEKDIQTLASFPLSNATIILSKMVLLWISQCLLGLLFTYPLFIAYGMVFKKVIFYYYMVLFYPFLMSFFHIGMAFLFLYPFKWICDFLKSHLLIQFILSLFLSFGFCFFYKEILDLFVGLLANNQLESLFSVSFLKQIVHVKEYIVPVNFLIDMMLLSKTKSFLFFICISLGVFLLGTTIVIFAYRHFIKSQWMKPKSAKKKQVCKIKPIQQALVKKELILLFKDSDHLFSFNNLLIIQPFLTYLVIASLNKIFTTGSFSYYLAFLPNFIPVIDVLLVILFSLTISQGANQFIQQEGRNVRLMKYIPVSFYKQLMIKMLLPLSFSTLSLFLTFLVLWTTRILSWVNVLFGFILCELFLIFFVMLSLFEEMKQYNHRGRSFLFSSIYTYLLPIVYFVLALVLSYVGLSSILIYSLSILVFFALVFPFVFHFKQKVSQLFIDLEVMNG